MDTCVRIVVASDCLISRVGLHITVLRISDYYHNIQGLMNQIMRKVLIKVVFD